MKPHRFEPRDLDMRHICGRHPRGFALVITLSLMILLTVIAVGLLTLSSISLRSSSQGDAMQTARANAKLALMLAIGDLQKQLGPDQRISATADQRMAGSDANQSSSAVSNRQWTGVYRSWPATSVTRPTPEFLAWLVSGDPEKYNKATAADTAQSGTTAIEMVGAGTLGDIKYGQVMAPSMNLTRTGGKPARIAWWVGDQGMKAAVATPPPTTDSSLAGVRNSLQGAPKNALEIATLGTVKPFEALKADDTRLSLVTSWRQSAFLASDISAPRGLFHDLAAYSTGMLTNVRAGGFRKDLSMQLERSAAAAPTTALYTVAGESGINLRELWAYYNLYRPEVLQRSGSATYTTGGRVASGHPFLQVKGSTTECAQDDYFFFKQPVILSYQMVFSFETKPVTRTINGVAVPRFELRLVADPILTLWNPLDVPVVIPTSAFMSVKYWQYPYDMNIRTNGGAPVRCPMVSSLSGATVAGDSDFNYLTLKLGDQQQLVFKPGEVIKVSQSNNKILRDGFDRNLTGKTGFNFLGGLSLPVKDLNGKVLDFAASDSITYEIRANNLTAGKTSSSGNSLSGKNLHSRHFSITHHEYYVGLDRGNAGNSLGIGGMFIDWDFGNKRLRPGEVRADNQPGTKPSTQRMYADRFPDVFKPIRGTDTRPLVAQEINARKAPFMIISFEAKTENGADAQTRFLSRFNPKALHVDFYDLSRSERDILPYEFKVDPLVSWLNRSLELSTNGNAYYGGGMNAEFGSSFVSTHSVPREPLVSLAAFQHSFANGFEMTRPTYGYAILNGREPMLPQISHAIGNSMAPPMIAPDKTEGPPLIPGPRTPLADHSYLANRALWDDWFLSGIAPQTVKSFGKSRDQKTVASQFFSGEAKLPVVRYSPSVGGQDPAKIATSLFSGSTPTNAATNLVASMIRVDGMFNVNSTSVEAWKCVLGTLKGRPVVVRDASGTETISPAGTETAVANLNAPQSIIASGSGNVDVKQAAQWTGRRTLTDDEIDILARAIVREVRKRGPFLSLADFVNRRVGSDKELARAGAIQTALDSDEVKVNDAYRSGTRSVPGDISARFPFGSAESGPKAFGIPGIIKQADILTPIAPILSARSDSFIVRSYGEAVDGTGKVLARAWCEAIVERDRSFIDPADAPETVVTSLSKKTNRDFGRRYELISFRWLGPSDI